MQIWGLFPKNAWEGCRLGSARRGRPAGAAWERPRKRPIRRRPCLGAPPPLLWRPAAASAVAGVDRRRAPHRVPPQASPCARGHRAKRRLWRTPWAVPSAAVRRAPMRRRWRVPPCAGPHRILGLAAHGRDAAKAAGVGEGIPCWWKSRRRWRHGRWKKMIERRRR